MTLATEAFKDVSYSWSPFSSYELAFVASSSPFHFCFNKAIMVDMLRPSKADFFFFLVLEEDLAGLVADVVASAMV